MAVFLEFKNKDGSPISVNPSRIAFFMHHNGGGTCLHFMNGAEKEDDAFVYVSDSYDDVKMRFRNASAQ